MPALFDAFWRASAYCLHPRVVLWSLLPLVVAAGGVLALGVFYWEPAVDGVRAVLDGWALTAALFQWLEAMGLQGLRALLAPMIVVALAVPVIVVVSLLLVAALMTPALVNLVAQRRFAQLERRRSASAAWVVLRSGGLGLVAVLALVASVPLWLVPPLVLVLPPLIWGVLATRVLAFAVLAGHASADERRALLALHRWPLLGMGVVTGCLAAVPGLLWAAGALALILAPLIVVLAVWLYTLVFAFAGLWFAHYALAALQALRDEREPDVVDVPSPAPGAVAPPASPNPALLPRPQT